MQIKVRTQNAKQLPSLKALLAEGRPAAKGAAAQRAALHQLSAQLGVPIVRRRRE